MDLLSQGTVICAFPIISPATSCEALMMGKGNTELILFPVLLACTPFAFPSEFYFYFDS